VPPESHVSHGRRGLERLLRRLVVHSHRPGVLYLHYWPAAHFDPPFMNDEVSSKGLWRSVDLNPKP